MNINDIPKGLLDDVTKLLQGDLKEAAGSDKIVVKLVSTEDNTEEIEDDDYEGGDLTYEQVFEVNGERYNVTTIMDSGHGCDMTIKDKKGKTIDEVGSDVFNAIDLAISCGEGPSNDGETKTWIRADFERAKKKAGLK